MPDIDSIPQASDETTFLPTVVLVSKLFPWYFLVVALYFVIQLCHRIGKKITDYTST
jgi:hypothetical protein